MPWRDSWSWVSLCQAVGWKRLKSSLGLKWILEQIENLEISNRVEEIRTARIFISILKQFLWLIFVRTFTHEQSWLLCGIWCCYHRSKGSPTLSCSLWRNELIQPWVKLNKRSLWGSYIWSSGKLYHPSISSTRITGSGKRSTFGDVQGPLDMGKTAIVW